MFTRDPEVFVPVRAPRPRLRVVVVLAAAGLLVGGLWLGRELLQSNPQAVTDTSSTAVSLPAVPYGGACSDWQGDLPTDPTRVTDITWTSVGNVRVPGSPGVGPASVDPLRWCYAHSLPGALYAAANFIGQQGTAALPVLATYLLADTPERGRILGASPAPPPTTPAPSQLLQWRGYHVITYDAAVVTLDVAHQWDGRLVAAVYTLLWENGDWKLAYPSSLQFQQRVVPGLDPEYWTSWSERGE